MRTRENGGIARWLGGALGVMTLLVLPAGDLRAIEFLRADSNSDGEVTISDAYFTLVFLFNGGQRPECEDAADTNGDGTINISDPVAVLNFLLGGGKAPAAPFPAPGEHAGPGANFPCDSYGNGEPLEDPAATLAISQVEADGGTSRNASFTLAVSSSGPLGGLYAEIVDEAGVIESVNPEAQNISSVDGDVIFLSVRLEAGVLTVGFLTSLLTRTVLPAGDNVDVLKIELCLKAGTAAGEYPLTLRAGELIAGCEGQCRTAGRAIAPALTSGTLVVASPVSAGAECALRSPPPPPVVDPRDGPPAPPPLPPGVELVGEIRIGSGEARRGEEVELPFIARSNGAIQAFSFSLDFDEEVLQATEVEERFIDPDSLARPFWQSFINNANETPGNGGVDEGYVVAAAVIDLLAKFAVLPADTDNEPVMLHFTVSPDTTAKSTAVRFMEGGVANPGSPGVQNAVTAFGMAADLVELDSIVMIDGILNILPDVSAFFIRGDANGDREVNITDPRFTLNYLFLGMAPPPCMDAADANDDGKVNLTDPIAILQLLFSGQSDLPEPFDAPGADPTEDALDCKEGIE